ncbi:MAG: hypothetical protein ABMA64_02745 [Myxococcota bacterium]
MRGALAGEAARAPSWCSTAPTTWWRSPMTSGAGGLVAVLAPLFALFAQR